MTALAVDRRRRGRVLAVGPFSLRVERRQVMLTIVLVMLSIAVTVVTLTLGDFRLTLGEVAGGLLGKGDEMTVMIVREWRLPRAAAALVFGGALGVSGAIFQTLTRNPLASPDVIGISSGSSFGATIVLLVIGGGYASVAAGSVLGGLLTAALVYAVAYRRGVQGFRLIIVGIAVTAMLGSATTYLVLKAHLQEAMRAAIWGAGSLEPVTAVSLGVVGILIALALAALVTIAPAIGQMELGDELAVGHGVRVRAVWLVAAIIGVALTALVTSVSGPIAFMSIAAPQIARRLAAVGSIPLVLSGVVGGTSLAGCDLVAQHALANPVPVGLVTVVIGGTYLLYLIVRESRARLR